MPSHRLTPDDLARFITEHDIPAELVIPPINTPTVAAAAAALGIAPAQVIKSLLFLVRDDPVLVIANGVAPVDRSALAVRFGIGKKQIRLADAATVLQFTGYPVGGVPPFGHPAPLLTLLDRSVLEWDTVYGGGGDERTLVQIASAELARITRAESIPLSLV